MGKLLKIAAVLIGGLIVADIVGVVVCVLIDVAPLRYKSGLLTYVIWSVLGIFTGLLTYNYAGAGTSEAIIPEKPGQDWTARPDAAAIGTQVVLTSVPILLSLAALFHWLYWSRGVGGEYFVPDSASHTVTFFVAIIAAMLLARFVLMPASGK